MVCDGFKPAVGASSLRTKGKQVRVGRNGKMGATMNQKEIAALGASLYRIDPKLLRAEKDSRQIRIWYQGDEPYFDVFFELKDGEIVWFQLTFRGKCVSWNQEQSRLQTGKTNELMVGDVSYYSASKLIQNDSTPDWELVEFARSILQSRAGEPVFARALALLESAN
ncbi:hypothetical protein [Kamptonema formosum]|uniref:hypothetical protein n=1 Tax=Kamptonema formosum TaxID=331992 RepID=UPI00034BB646|nr:hypothetical protein [Oscillatoria sp. PCC 10802]